MKTKLKILRIIKWIYVILIAIFALGFIFIIKYQWCLYVLLSFFIVIISLYLIIHLLRSKIYIYTCPNCQHEFTISFIKDISAYNSSIGTKVLVCPKCSIKEVMKAKIKEDDL